MSFKECACIKKQSVRQDQKGFEGCHSCQHKKELHFESAPSKEKEEPEAPTRPNYVPQPYTFRSPSSGPEGQQCKTVRSPPFWLQVDHTLAVIWCIFSPQQTQRKLGITQLQWALEFLKGIHTRRGDHPKDVLVCIQAIEDRLIEQYAGMQRVIRRTSTCCGTPTCTICGKKSDSSPESGPESSPHSSPDASTTQKEKEDDAEPESGSLHAENDEKEPVFGPCPGGVEERSLPLSITYEALLQRTRPGALPTAPIQSELFVHQSIEDNPSDLPFNIPAAIRGALPAGTVPSKDDLLSLLNKFRREQVDRIQGELDRLHSIEKYMSNVDKGSFIPFIEQVDDNKTVETEPKMKSKCLCENSTQTSKGAGSQQDLKSGTASFTSSKQVSFSCIDDTFEPRRFTSSSWPRYSLSSLINFTLNLFLSNSEPDDS